jgi:hypothetical protein
MSNDKPNPRPNPRRPRARRVSADDRHDRHLELVTDGWVAELADLVVLRPLAGRLADPRRAMIVRAADRVPRPGSEHR